MQRMGANGWKFFVGKCEITLLHELDSQGDIKPRGRWCWGVFVPGFGDVAIGDTRTKDEAERAARAAAAHWEQNQRRNGMTQLLHRDGTLLHEANGTMREVVLDAYRRGLGLSGANLFRANLSRANLFRANLSRADLYGANLSRANLPRADLSRANLSGANLSRAHLYGANLYGADLSGANLYGADLYGANLFRVSLSGANLSGADLYGANLYGADLSGADLYGAIGVDALRCTPLLMLLDQPGSIRLYKLVTAAGDGAFAGGIAYEVGQSYEVINANTDPSVHCAAGINVATMDWCIREWRPGYRVLVVEFTAADIACIPTATDGKIRLHRCTVVGEKSLDELGLVVKEGQP